MAASMVIWPPFPILKVSPSFKTFAMMEKVTCPIVPGLRRKVIEAKHISSVTPDRTTCSPILASPRFVHSPSYKVNNPVVVALSGEKLTFEIRSTESSVLYVVTVTEAMVVHDVLDTVVTEVT